MFTLTIPALIPCSFTIGSNLVDLKTAPVPNELQCYFCLCFTFCLISKSIFSPREISTPTAGKPAACKIKLALSHLNLTSVKLLVKLLNLLIFLVLTRWTFQMLNLSSKQFFLYLFQRIRCAFTFAKFIGRRKSVNVIYIDL